MRHRIGVVPQRANADRGLSVIENLIFHAAYFGFTGPAYAARARELLQRMGIAERADAKVDQLSGGQQQRLMIARALISEVVAPLIGVVQPTGRQVTNIRLVPPSLETLFLSLTGRKLQ